MKRPGIGAAPLVDVPVVVGLHDCERELLVGARRANSRPENDGNDGKHMHASTPPALMSFTRSCTS